MDFWNIFEVDRLKIFGGKKMIDDEIAIAVVKTCIRVVGGLTTGDHIRLQNKLGDLRIKTDPQLRQLKLRIVEMLSNLPSPCELDIGFLGGVDTSATVNEVVEIVAANSERTA